MGELAEARMGVDLAAIKGAITRDYVGWILSALDGDDLEQLYLASGVGTEEDMMEIYMANRSNPPKSRREYLPQIIAERWGDDWQELMMNHLTSMTQLGTIFEACADVDPSEYLGQEAASVSQALVESLTYGTLLRESNFHGPEQGRNIISLFTLIKRLHSCRCFILASSPFLSVASCCFLT